LAAVFDCLGYGLFYLPGKFKGLKRNPRRILVIRLDHIGDFVNTLPLFRNLEVFLPEAKVTALVNPAVKELAELCPAIDEVMVFDAPWLRKKRGFSLARFFKTAKEISRRNFELGIDARGDLISLLLMYFGRVSYRIGYGITAGGFLVNKEPHYEQEAHAIQKAINLLKELFFEPQPFKPEVYCRLQHQQAVDALLKDYGLNSAKLLALHPYAGTPAKEWSEDKFSRLIKLLRAEGWQVLLLGTAADTPDYEGTHDFRGRLSLAQLPCLLKRTQLFVGLDSGPANLALALDIPSIVICSGTNIPQHWLVPSQKRILVYQDSPCKPCGRMNCPRQSHDCLEGISVEEVKREIDYLLVSLV
jgi:ADP-heptose:LPS heptosyltransferase